MAKGLEKHQERMGKLSRLGKDLTRRSGASCELCDSSGVSLSIYEVPPVPAEPELERCVFVCPTCSEQLENPKRMDVQHWRCVAQSVWSEVPAVQVVAARVLDRFSRSEVWAREALDEAYFEEEVESWISSQPL